MTYNPWNHALVSKRLEDCKTTAELDRERAEHLAKGTGPAWLGAAHPIATQS